MLYVLYLNDRQQTWHTGEKLRKSEEGKDVQSIQADGHELEWIKAEFDNLPCPKNKAVVTFYGDLAKMIYDALPSRY